MKETILKQAYSAEAFTSCSHQVMNMIENELRMAQTDMPQKTIPYLTPEEELKYWEEDFNSEESVTMQELMERVLSHSIHLHSKQYAGHQVAVPLPVTALSSAVIGCLNNGPTVYEMGMPASAMEKIIIGHLAEKFGYDKQATGFVTSGGSLGNLTALVTARTSTGVMEKDYHRLAIMVSSEAHYSVERAAKIMGISSENVIKVPADEKHCIRPELLEGLYQKAVSEDKIVFCIVGCACTTAVGAYDDLNAVADFAEQHNLWFHVDGAHGGPAIFSKKYRHLLAGVERSDSLIMDFHKMMMAPFLSTAVIYNSRNRKVNEFAPQAAYLWQDQLSEEWYNSAKHTIECSKPSTIINTYTIMRLYGDEIYEQHIDAVFGLAKRFAEMVQARENMEVALPPVSNIVCFRCLANGRDCNLLNKRILDELVKDGDWYIVGTTLNDTFYLRVSLMNPMTDEQCLKKLLDKIQELSRYVCATK